MTKSDSPTTGLFHRLSVIGLSRPYIRSTALPDWWDDRIADHPSGYAELLLLLARHLGLSLESLQDAKRPLAFRDFGVCKFKKTAGTTNDDLLIAQTLGTRAAQLAAAAMAGDFQLRDSALEMRLRILDRGAPWVGLRELLAYCWRIGIPVIILTRFPPRAKKMHGMSAMFKGRPIIVLSRNVKSPAWLLFILAHELGHIACGHLKDGTVLIDQDVDKNEQDQEEVEANAFALELLSGEAKFQVHTSGRWPNAKELAQLAHENGIKLRIDPGHMILNYAHTMGSGFWPVANAALKHLDPEGNGPSIVRSALADNLDWSALPKDSSEFLMRVTRPES